MATGSPIGDIFVIQGDAALGELLNDDRGGSLLGEHLIDEGPQFFGEFGDFAIARVSGFGNVHD